MLILATILARCCTVRTVRSDDPAELVGTLIADRYRVGAFVAAGSMGRVYEVEDVTSGRQAAIKILRSELGGNAELAARLVREGKAMSMLAHRNIVELLDVGCLEDGTPFVVTELIRGVELTAVLAEGPVARERAISIVRQVLDALDHAHRHGVIHRDIKPENIMLVADLVKVLDFGVAKLADDTAALLGEGKLTRAGFELFGSPHYVAPEVVLGRLIDARTDLYAAGVVLFQLLAGVPPFDDPDPMVLLNLHATGKVPTLAERAPDRTFSPELEYVVAEALAKQPERRFESASDMIAMLDLANKDTTPVAPAPVAVEPVVVDPVVFTPPPPPPAAIPATAIDPRVRERRRFLIMASGVAALVLLVCIAWLARGGSKAPTTASKTAPAPGSAATAAPRPPDPGNAMLARAHANVGKGNALEALAQYEQAIAQDSQLAADAQIRADAIKIVTGKDPVAAVVGLELLATRLDPAEHDLIVQQASVGALREVRQRAFAIAVRDSFADRIDRFESFSLDLRQARSCDERRAVIARLRDLSDRRAIGALRRVETQFPCVDREAAEARTYLEAQP